MDYQLSPNSILTPAEIRRRVRRVTGVEEDLVVAAANVATTMFESLTRRQLKERIHVAPVTITCTTTVDSPSVSGSGFAALKPLMDAVGANVGFGSRIKTIAGDAALTLTENAKASGAAPITFGSLPLYVDGDLSTELLLPESPVTEVYSVSSRDRDGVLEALDVSGMFIDGEAGIVRVPYAPTPVGARNIEIACRAGYRPRTATDLGHEAWPELVSICLGIAEVLFRDYKELLGRATEATLGGEKLAIPDIELPRRLELSVRRFEREVDVA